MNQLVEKLKIALIQHDWNYAYSDDFGVYNAGQASVAKIGELRKQCAAAGYGAEAEKLYEIAVEAYKNAQHAKTLL